MLIHSLSSGRIQAQRRLTLSQGMWSICSQLLGHEGQQRPPETCNCAISMPLGRMLHFAAAHRSSLGAPDSMGCCGAQWNGYGLCWVSVGNYESLGCPMSSCAALWALMG